MPWEHAAAGSNPASPTNLMGVVIMIEFKDFLTEGVDLILWLNVTPAERMTRDYPGHPREFEVDDIEFLVRPPKKFEIDIKKNVRIYVDTINKLSLECKMLIMEAVDPDIYYNIEEKLDEEERDG